MNIAGTSYPQTAQYKNSHCMLSFRKDSGDTSLCPQGINQCLECHVYIQLNKGSLLDHFMDALSQRIKENETSCNADDQIRRSEMAEILNSLEKEISRRLGTKVLDTSKGAEEIISKYRACINKSICNGLNKDKLTLICGKEELCNVINYYEGMINNYEHILNDDPIKKPPSKLIRKVKVKINKRK